jgi:cation:H+ antiporter
VALFVVGLALVIYFAEKLVKGAVHTSLGFGVSAFLIAVVFIGFDPENLAVGTVASARGAPGIALGTIVGAAMVAIAFAFGVTALLAPMKFERAPARVLAVPVAAVALLGLLAADGLLSRADGVILLAAFGLALLVLFRMTRRGFDVEPTGEVAESLEEGDRLGRWKAFGLLVVSIAAIVLGSEMLVAGSERIIVRLGLSETVFGMTVLAFLVSVEELARELPAAMEGRPEISFGNVVGSALAFFLFNAGIIALANPVPVGSRVLRFYLPVAFAAIVLVSLFVWARSVSRAAGVVLVLLYLAFVLGGYVT